MASSSAALTYMGSVSAKMKGFMEATSKHWLELKWRDKVAGGFTNSAAQSGDKLDTVIDLVIFAMPHGRSQPLIETGREMRAMYVLNDKVAIITGASAGIGRVIAERLALEGAAVVVNYGKSADKAKEVVATIESRGGKAVAMQADMSKVADARRLVRDTMRQLGRLDILVNNAGMTLAKSLVDTTEQEFDDIFALNVKGPYFAWQEAAKVIADGGRIVNISSGGTHIGVPGATAYLGTKAALEQFTKGLAHELAPKGVTVNTVSPGFTDTAMLWDSIRETGAEMSPLKRLGKPQDIADVVAFVVSDQGRWLTGQTIHASGGVVM
jgi:3-oxoacyl-[acyl-carrier protein] reductase